MIAARTLHCCEFCYNVYVEVIYQNVCVWRGGRGFLCFSKLSRRNIYTCECCVCGEVVVLKEKNFHVQVIEDYFLDPYNSKIRRVSRELEQLCMCEK